MRIFIVIIFCLITKVCFATFKNGGSKVNVGMMPAKVSTLEDSHPNADDIGAQIFNLEDSQMYRWNGQEWKSLSINWQYVKSLADDLYYPKNSNPSNYLTSVPYVVKVWSKSAQLSSSGIMVVDTFLIATSTPTITLALPTGTTAAKIMAATGYRSGATINNSPQVAISAMTSTTVSLVMSQQNTSTVSILGINVLSGNPIIAVPDPTNVKVILSYIAY